MARRSKALEALGDVDRERLDADLMRGTLSWDALSKRYGVPVGTLRDYSARHGIVRNPTGLKRAIVEAALARPEPLPAPPSAGRSAGQSSKPAESADEARAEIEKAAQEDIRDSRLALQSARMALSIVASMLQKAVQTTGPNGEKIMPSTVYEPKELKILAETTGISIGTVRLLRGLDIAFTPEDMKKMSDEQLRKIAAGQSPR